jgi:phage-related protein
MPVERFKAEVDADILSFKRKMAEVDRQMRDLATGVSVEINASINEFITKVHQVQAQLQKLDATEATVEIDAKLNDFMRDLLQVRALAQEMDGETIKVKTLLDADVFYTQLMMIRAEIDAIERERAKIEVEMSLGSFMRDYARVETLLAQLSSQSGDIKIDIDFSEVIAAIHEVKLAILALKDVTVDIHADISNFMRGAAVVQRVSQRLESKNIFVKIWVDYSNAMKSYANTVQAFAEAGQQILGGALLSLVPVLSQALSVLVGLIGSLGAMVGVLAGQFLILASALSVTALGFAGLAAVAIPTIKNLFDETAKLNAEQQRAKASWDAFKSTYDDLVKATEKPVLQGFTSAMQAAQKILKSLEPLIISVTNSAAKLMDAFNKSINTQPIQKIFDTFNKYGASIFENMVTGIGHFVAGIGSLIAALTPAAEVWSSSFNSMMQSFALWADGLAQSEGFQAFISYIQTYMPVISEIFANLTMGIIAFFTAFADMGGSFMTSLAEMTERFRTWAETLGENQQFQEFLSFIQESTPAVLTLLGNLWDLIINLGIAFAPIGAAVLDMANAFLEWFNNLLSTNETVAMLVAALPVVLGAISALAPIVISVVSIFGNLAGAVLKVIPSMSEFSTVITKVTSFATKAWDIITKLGSVFSWLVTPVGLVVAAIAGFVAILVTAYNKVEWFRNFINEAWDKISTKTKEVFGKISKDISEALTTIVNFGKKQLGKFQKLWDEHGEKIMEIVSKIGVVVTTGFSLMMNAALTTISVGWSLISMVFQNAWTLISSIIDVGITLILGIVEAGMALLQGDWEKAWDVIVETATSIGSTIVDAFTSIIGDVWQAGVDIVNGLIEGITSMFDSVAKALGKLTDKIPKWVKEALG